VTNAPPEAVTPPPPSPLDSSPEQSAASVSVRATGFSDLATRRIGAEIGASAGFIQNVDFGLAATLGYRIGGRATVTLYSPISWFGLTPFAQLRGIFNPMPEGVGVGGGLWVGSAYEAGPGRIIGGVTGEFVSGPRQYAPVGVWLMAGYEFDMLPKNKGNNLSGMAAIKGRVSDTEDQPVNAVVTFPGAIAPLGDKRFDAGPTFETKIPPGQYIVEVNAPGYLVRGQNISAKAGETLVVDFVVRKEPKERSAVLTDTSVEIRQMIQFEFNKATLIKTSLPVLDEVADILIKNKNLRILVEGHTDDVGGPEVNKKLSQDRADAVRDYLTTQGVDPTRLSTRGYGLSKPISTNTTDVGRAVNRRVQFTITGK
jgi:outer membrane protein OmpA-like peptidoglycan-associated protein